MLAILKKNKLPFFIILIASIVFLTNLSGQDFSLDEPYVVVLAISILKYDLPYVWDGVNFLSGSNGLDSTEFFGKNIWTFSPWIEHYLAAVGITFFGDTVFGARFFFAVFGILTVGLLYKISKELFGNVLISVLLSFHLIFSLPFFLYIRQTRYYSPACFFSTVVVWLLILKLKNKWKNSHTILFIMSSLLLFFTNYVVWLTTILIVSTIFLYKKNNLLLSIVGIEMILAGIWYISLRPYGGNVLFFNQLNTGIARNVIHYLSYINSYIFPFMLIIMMIFFKMRFSKLFFFLTIWILVKLIFYSVFLVPHGRYLVEVFPVLILFFGFFYKRVLQYKKGLFIVLVIFATSLMSNILSFRPKSFIFFPYPFFIELARSYPGIMPKIGNYLHKNYQQGNLFWSNEYRMSLYYYGKVPTISPVCNISSNTFTGPVSIINPENIKWFIFFRYDDRLTQNLAFEPCFGKDWQEKLSKEYTRITFPTPKDIYFRNDSDIVNRQFPPRKVYKDEIEMYIRKS